jgi:peptidoglycan/LPS O-acetylase OafA/YrhL
MSASSPQHTAYRSVRTFASLDGLRCVSILAVVYHHSHGPLHFGRFFDRGFLGVDLFFEISGFLIVTLLLREQERTGDISWRHFMARRALRIFPLYFGIVALLALVLGFVRTHGSQAGAFFAELPQVLTYTTNWFPATTILGISWSLSAEEQFYLLWPPIQKYVKHAVVVLLGLLVVSQVIHFGLIDARLEAWFGWSPTQPPMLRQTTFTPILLGVLLAYLLHWKRSFDRVATLLGHPASPLLLLGLLIVGACLLPADITGWPRLSIHIVMMALLASCVVREDHWLAPLCTWKPVARIGVLSYGLYLWHLFALDPATRLVGRGMLHPALLFPATLFGAIVIAELSYRLYESRFLKLKGAFGR